MPSVMELVGYRAQKCDAENLGVTDGGVRGVTTGMGYGIPSRRVRREVCQGASAPLETPEKRGDGLHRFRFCRLVREMRFGVAGAARCGK